MESNIVETQNSSNNNQNDIEEGQNDLDNNLNNTQSTENELQAIIVGHEMVVSSNEAFSDSKDEPNLPQKQKIALVTGGISGIGKAIALLLHQNNYKVIVSYRTNDKAAKEFFAETGIWVTKFDVSDYDDCKNSIEAIINEYGQIHCLINNAGITSDNMLHKMALNEWQNVMRTNLDGVFNVCRHVIEHMRMQKFGRIVNVSSVNGLTGQFGQCNYAASKAGMIGFTKSLARESASKGITVNCVAPGYTETEMTMGIKQDIKDKIIEQIPIKRFAMPKEIAAGVLYLLESEYVTGHTLSINGGLHMN